MAKLVTVFFCLLSLFLASCNPFGGENNAQPVKQIKAPLDKQTYTIPIVGIPDFETLDPALAHDPTSTRAIQMIFTGLVQLNNKLQVVPQLAQSWQLGEDGVTWTFKLKPDLKFSDGTALTSADVVYSLNRALLPATQSTVAPLYLKLIRDADQLLAGKIPTLIGKSLLTPDKTTVVIVTSHNAAYFLSALTMPCSYVLQKNFVEKHGAQFTDYLTSGGGAGPFKVQEYRHGKEMRLVPNSHYYNAQPQLQKVNFVFYHSQEGAYQAYQSNLVDTTGIPTANFENDKKRSDFHQVPQLWIHYYTMNYLVKPFDNIHIRQAFALAIDKQALAKNVWKGTVIPTNHIVPEGIAGYNPQLQGPNGTQKLTGDPEKAQALLQQGLKEEGWKDVKQMPPLTLTYAQNVPKLEQEVKSIIEMWEKVLHVTVKRDPIAYNTLLDRVTASTQNQKGLQMWSLSWVGEYPDSQNWLSHQFGKGSPNNNMNYGQNTSSNARQQESVQQQLAKADMEGQVDARLQSYSQAEQELVNAVAWLPIAQITDNFLRNRSIVGITDNGQGIIPPDDWAHIYRVE